MTSPIRIAVIGGGLAGAIVANSLRKTPLVDVQVYESAPEFSERGLGIGLSKLALQALEEIIPSATDLLRSDAGAVDIGASRIVIVRMTLSLPILKPNMLMIIRARGPRRAHSCVISREMRAWR